MKMIGMARLGRDVELRYTANNVPVANLSLAFNYGPKDQNGKRQVQWIEGALWRERAEALAEWLFQGQQLYVEVRDVHVETFTKGDGSLGTKLVGDVTELEFGAAPQGGGQNQGHQGNGGGQQRQQRQQGSGGYQGGNGGPNRAQGGQQRPQQGNQGGGYGNQQQSPGQRQRTQQNAQRPAQQPAATGGGFANDGFSDMDDDIPF